MPRAKKPRTPPTRSHAARAARGKVPVMLSLSPTMHALLGVMAGHLGLTRSATVERALAGLFAATPREGD